MIKNIIFDMGNVLIDFNPMQYIGQLKLEDREEEVKIFKAAYLNYKSIYMDYGKITEEEIVNHIVKDIGEDYPDNECQSSKSLDLKYHLHYFNPDTELGLRCS